MAREPAADVAVSVDGVSKTFRLPREQSHTLKERALHPLRGTAHDRLEALRDVSFEVKRGEAYGIVGRNGSGKSTLMKCLAGIYRADAGEMWLRGRMAPFIELGVGFNPDLTAHDNVLINAIMLGLTPAQARERYDEIVAFAELEEFVDLKLKNYSSGMQVRLAFAVMVHVDADLLLIDEVLAVGDAAFQQKCFDVLHKAREEGRTILLVTHDMGQVQRFCDRGMLLHKGNLMAVGDARTVARQYMQLNFAADVSGADAEAVEAIIASDGGDGGADIVDAWFQDRTGARTDTLEQGASCALLMRVRFGRATQDPVFGFALADEQRRRVFVVSTDQRGEATGSYAAGDEVDVAVSFDNFFAPGRYWISPQITHPGAGMRLLAYREDVATAVITGSGGSGGGAVDIPHAFRFFPREPEAAASEEARA